MSTLLPVRTTVGAACARASATAVASIPAPRAASEPVTGARHHAEVGKVATYIAATRADLRRPTHLEPVDGEALRGIVVALAASAPFWALAVLALGLSR